MTIETESIDLLKDALITLQESFAGLPAFDSKADLDAIAPVLQQVARRMRDNYPYPHPFYAGQMLKPPHPVARLAYTLALYLNPNNHALDGGRASSAMEKEAVAAIAGMFGWGARHLGHLSSAGTTANLEALWVAGKLHPGKSIAASAQAHYTHARLTEALQIPFACIAVDSHARMDIDDLERQLRSGAIGTVVATLGTTGGGSVDPLDEIMRLRRRYEFRVHVDAAYGGYFHLADNLGADARRAFDCIDAADSIVVDPHKHGLQPYGCGCVLFRDPAVGAIYRHDSPYTYFTSADLHLGEISLECSRAGAAAVALWATQRLLPLTRGGEFARGLARCRAAAVEWHRRRAEDRRDLTVFAPQLDIVLWAARADTASAISRRSQAVFDACARAGLHLAVMKLPAALLRPHWPQVEFDGDGDDGGDSDGSGGDDGGDGDGSNSDGDDGDGDSDGGDGDGSGTVTVLRSCMMKPEHLDWLQRIDAAYRQARDSVG